MHVRFKISHANHSGSLTEAFAAQFGPAEPEVLGRSVVFPGDSRGVMAAKLAYACETDTYRLMVIRGSNSDLDVILEETPHARLMAEAQPVWEKLRAALRSLSLRPRLTAASVNAEARDVAVAIGQISRRTHLLSDSVLVPAVILILFAAFIAVAGNTFAKNNWPTMLVGGITVLVNFVYFGVRGIVRALRASIVWRLARDGDS